MLELPESYTISKQMDQTLTGKIISYIEILHTPHNLAFFFGEKEKFADYLEGERITCTSYHGGMIEMDTENSMIVFADGAYPRYYEDKKKFPKNHQMAIYFDDETAVFVSVQICGFFFVFPQGECRNEYYVSACSKISPLSDEFSYEYFKSQFDFVFPVISGN